MPTKSRKVRDVKPFLMLGIRAEDVAADDEYARHASLHWPRRRLSCDGSGWSRPS